MYLTFLSISRDERDERDEMGISPRNRGPPRRKHVFRWDEIGDESGISPRNRGEGAG